ncbi:MAG: TIGR03960 family B12-binding radical SAM protein [Myxococcota bacterium]
MSSTTLSEHPYASFLHTVQKPARYTGEEYQSVHKDWDTTRVRICMAFPDIYDIGMSHLGTKIIYGLLNDREEIACERSFSPWVDMEAALRERDLPLISLESARPLTDFDAVGISLQYEMTYTNVLNLLDLAGIPLRSEDRDERWPLILGGGPTCTHPEPMAPFFDAFLVGDAEEILPRTLLNIADWRDEGLPRREVLTRLAAMGGWYCPALYTLKEEPRNDLLVVDPETSAGPYPVERAHVADLTAYPFPTNTPVPAAEAIFDRVSMEIARGCTEGCRFCQAGMIYRPVRERDPEQVIDAVMDAIERGGYDEVSLTSLSTADYSCISPLIKTVMSRLRERRVSLSVSSLRAYGLSGDLLDEIASVKATGLTFAPEAGTQRMRDVVNKNITDEDIETTAERVFSRGWKRMKLYFMIGLPTEEDEDVAGIVHTSSRLRKIGRQHHGKRAEVTASASSHVPKPHTPFQWAAMDSYDEIVRKHGVLKDIGRQHRITVKTHNPKVSFLEGIVARGDRRVADLVETAWRKGCRFDGWDEHLNWDAWLEAIEEWGVPTDRYLGTLPLDGALPWDHIDVGLAPKFLSKEWKRATKDRLSPPCSKPLGEQVHHTNMADAIEDERKLICYHCGVACDLTAMREERLTFLEKLGAKERPTPRAEDDLPEWKTVRTNRLGQTLPPKRADQGQSYSYRLIFTKLATTSLTSQLDLTRSLPRIIRRAGMVLKYSEGFSPKPQLTYGPALPLGVPSLSEVVDVIALTDIDPTMLAEQINAVSDPGLRVVDAARLPDGVRSCARSAKLAEYVLACPGTWGVEELTAAAARATSGDPLMTMVTRKRGDREVNILAGLQSAEVDYPSVQETRLLALGADTPLLRVKIDLNEGAHVRAEELALALTGADERPQGFITARTALWGLHKGKVFELLDPPIVATPKKAPPTPEAVAAVAAS